MRVLYVNALFPTPGDHRAIGGAETFSVRLVNGLVACGHEVEVVRSGTIRQGTTTEIVDGVPIYSMPQRNIYPAIDSRSHGPLPRAVWHFLEDHGRIPSEFAKIAARFKPTLVHTNNLVGLTTDIWRAARIAGFPILHTLHDYYLTCPRVMRIRGATRCETTCVSCRLLSQQRRKATSNVNVVVGVSKRMLDIHRAEGLFLNTPSKVILNTPPPSHLTTRFSNQAPLSITTFGFIGRLSVEKGIYEILEAFKTLPAGQARLLVAGAGSPDVQAWVKQHALEQQIVFTGFIKPEEFYPQVDVVVVPSLWEEPCSMVVGEALSSGIPVIGARRGGSAELLRGGQLGWLFEPGTGQLETKLAELVAHPAMIREMADRIGANLSESNEDSLVADYIAAYEQMSACTLQSQRQGAAGE